MKEYDVLVVKGGLTLESLRRNVHEAMNHYAASGWRVVQVTHVASLTVLITLERDVHGRT